ncbi:MAG: DUF3160 domain-containing protein [Deltaproteobacteria bacterium]
MSRTVLVALLVAAPSVAAAQDTGAFDVYRTRFTDLSGTAFLQELPKPDRAKLGFDPTKAEYFDTVAKELKLTREERDIFKKHGLVSVDHGVRYSFGASYYAIYARDMPVFITTDSILHAVHKSYDDILMQLETSYLAPTIQDVLTQVHGATNKTDHDVDLYVTVALNLLAGSKELTVHSKLGQDEAAQVLLDKVASLKLETPNGPGTKIYGGKRTVDWSQFKPRGHYTKSEQLKRYFRAMMWLGRADTGFEIADSDRQLTSAMRLVALVDETGGLKKLGAMNDIVDFMVGASDNLTAFQLRDAMKGAKNLDAVKKRIAKHGKQAIRSQVVVSNPHDTIEVEPPTLFQLFGQRFVIDSFVLSKVVFDSILYKNKKVLRMMPNGLDVMTALGNDEAARLLAPELERFPYAGNLKAARAFIAEQPAAYWRSNVYNAWLGALRTLDDKPSGRHVPRVMRSEAWDRKQLQTQLGSWAELRHDTILYAKQSYTAWPSCEYPTGYVEPYPDFYRAIETLAREAQRRIRLADYGKADWMKTRQVQYFDQLADTMQRLAKIAERELAAQPLTSSDEDWLKKTIDKRGGGSGPPRYDGWYPQIFYGGGVSASEWDPTVADVHTDPKGGKVREVAVGDTQFLVVAIDNEDDRTVYVGPVFSYYEFDHPVSDRLTDEQWQGKIRTNTLPERPAWWRPYQGARKERHTGR